MKSKFSEEFQKSVGKQAKIVADYLGITSERQSFWFAILFLMYFQQSAIPRRHQLLPQHDSIKDSGISHRFRCIGSKKNTSQGKTRQEKEK